MIEGVYDKLTSLSVDSTGVPLDKNFDLPPDAGVSFIVRGHDQPVALAQDDGTSGLPMAPGLAWKSGPYHAGGQIASAQIVSLGSSTTLDLYILWDDSEFEHRTLGERIEVESSSKSLAGEQSISAASQTAKPVNPASNGAGDPCDILIQNAGDVGIWINSSSGTVGTLLKPGENSGEQTLFLDHTNEDGDIQLYPDGGSMSAEVLFRS